MLVKIITEDSLFPKLLDKIFNKQYKLITNYELVGNVKNENEAIKIASSLNYLNIISVNLIENEELKISEYWYIPNHVNMTIGTVYTVLKTLWTENQTKEDFNLIFNILFKNKENVAVIRNDFDIKYDLKNYNGKITNKLIKWIITESNNQFREYFYINDKWIKIWLPIYWTQYLAMSDYKTTMNIENKDLLKSLWKKTLNNHPSWFNVESSNMMYKDIMQELKIPL